MVAVKKTVRRAKGKPFQNPIAVARARKIDSLQNKTTKVKRARASPRLYMKSVFSAFPRGMNHSNKSSCLLRIDNCNTMQDADFYVGKRCCYVYHGQKERKCVRWSKARARRSNTRATWGRVLKVHGRSGMVRAKFHPTLPGQALGKRVRVYLYPSRV